MSDAPEQTREGGPAGGTGTGPTGPRAEDIRVLIVMGVTGTGKSTVAALLAGQLGWDLEEGDDLHPEANVAKMRGGEPLTDEDRWPWLDRISGWIREHTRSGVPGIITCSSLKRAYRDRLSGPGVVFVHLSASKEDIQARLDRRLDHFMPSSLLDSQLKTLEPLEPDERGVVIPLGGRPREEVARVLDRLGLTPADAADGANDPADGAGDSAAGRS